MLVSDFNNILVDNYDETIKQIQYSRQPEIGGVESNVIKLVNELDTLQNGSGAGDVGLSNKYSKPMKNITQITPDKNSLTIKQ